MTFKKKEPVVTQIEEPIKTHTPVIKHAISVYRHKSGWTADLMTLTDDVVTSKQTLPEDLLAVIVTKATQWMKKKAGV